MNEQLLKMNGLSVEILDALSFESHLGIPLKNHWVTESRVWILYF